MATFQHEKKAAHHHTSDVADNGNIIRGDEEEIRTSFTDKVEALEQQVSNSVQDAASGPPKR